jgi:hypothetical protein
MDFDVSQCALDIFFTIATPAKNVGDTPKNATVGKTCCLHPGTEFFFNKLGNANPVKFMI